MKPVWTQEKDTAVATLISHGISASSIAKELGTTRNAVLGRRFRLGLSKKVAPRPRRRAGLKALGRAARACGFTIAELEQLRKVLQEDGL